MKQFDTKKVDAKIMKGVRELCEILKVPSPTGTISEQALKYLIVILRERRDIPGLFPSGKDVTINALELLIETPEVEIKLPIDRHKVAIAIELLEEAKVGEFGVQRYGEYQDDWSYRLDLYEKSALDIVLKRVHRVKREKPYESSASVYGTCKIEGLPVCVRDVGKCEIVYEEYEVEEDEMVPSGKKIKVKKKRSIVKCPDADIVSKNGKNMRRVTT